MDKSIEIQSGLLSFLLLQLALNVCIGTAVSAEDDQDLRHRKTRLVPIMGSESFSIQTNRQPDGKIHVDGLLNQAKEAYLKGDSAAAQNYLRFMLIAARSGKMPGMPGLPGMPELSGMTDSTKALERSANDYLTMEIRFLQNSENENSEAKISERPGKGHSDESDFIASGKLEKSNSYLPLAKKINHAFCELARSAREAGNDSASTTPCPEVTVTIAGDGSLISADLQRVTSEPSIDRLALDAVVMAFAKKTNSSKPLSGLDAIQLNILLSLKEDGCRVTSASAGTNNDGQSQEKLKQVMKSSGLVCNSAEDWATLAYYLDYPGEDLFSSDTASFIAWRKACQLDPRPAYLHELCQSLANKAARSAISTALITIAPKTRPLEIGKLYQIAKRFPIASQCYAFQLFLDPANEPAKRLNDVINQIPETEREIAAKSPARNSAATNDKLLAHIVECLPSTSETVICSRLQPSESKASYDDIESGMAALLPWDILSVAKVLTKDQFVGLVSGCEQFRTPNGLGAWSYKGATIFVYRELDRKKLDEAIKPCQEKYREHGIDIWCHHEKMEDEDAQLLYCLPAPNLLVVATDRDYLKALLDRIADATSIKDSVTSRPEFRYVDTTQPYWAIRHYDWKSIRYQGMGSPFIGIDAKQCDGKVQGLVISRAGQTQNVLVQYIIPSDSARAQMSKSFQSAAQQLKIKPCTAEGQILKLTFPTDNPETNLRLHFMLGYAVNI